MGSNLLNLHARGGCAEEDRSVWHAAGIWSDLISTGMENIEMSAVHDVTVMLVYEMYFRDLL